MTETITNSSDQTFYNNCVMFLSIISIPTYISCCYFKAPYGRHTRKGWGPTIPSYISWFLMESPSVISTLCIYLYGHNATSVKSLSLLSIFLLHYIHRTFIYPLRLKNTSSTATRFPVSIALIAFSFNLFNSYVQARWISHYGDYGMENVLFWKRFVLGLLVFGVGMVINVKADYKYLELKKKGEGYKIPKGGCFEYVSCPNYFGEIVEWFGWSIMTWSWAGFGFFLYTCANLVPRACANHKWYLEKFGEDYPKHRRAIMPFLY